MNTITPEQLSVLLAEYDIRSPIRSVTIEDDSVILRTAWEAYQVPFPSAARTVTIPEPTDTLHLAAEEPPTAAPPEPDDYTVIDGVGRITAQKLHDLGLHTYEDLRTWVAAIDDQDDIPAHTIAGIVAWLQTYPF